MAGFLPPFNPETGYEIGWVEFRVGQKEGLPTGTRLGNQAFVEFDFAGDIYDHPAPKEGPWVNTIDAGSPSSWVEALPAETIDPAIPVSWDGHDENGAGSGIASYDIYVSDNGGLYQLWLNSTTETSAVFPGEGGHTYRFYSRATDNVGHVESAPTGPDAETTTYLASVTCDAVINGTAGGDTLVITATGPDSGSYCLNGGASVILSDLISFTFNGLDGDDRLTIDNPASGVFAPSGGVFYNGGAGSDDLTD